MTGSVFPGELVFRLNTINRLFFSTGPQMRLLVSDEIYSICSDELLEFEAADAPTLVADEIWYRLMEITQPKDYAT